MPVATLNAMSSPSQVLAGWGAPPMTPTDVGAPEPFHKPAQGALRAGDLPHADHGKRLIHSRGHLHTFTFFLNIERGCLG